MYKNIKAIGKSIYREFKLLVGALLNKANSRKFLVFLVATHMTYMSILGADDWSMIAMLYMGIQGVLDWKKNATTTTPGTIQNSEEMPGLPPPQ